jgi:hypothetical protein
MEHCKLLFVNRNHHPKSKTVYLAAISKKLSMYTFCSQAEEGHFQLRATIYKFMPAPSDVSTVQS